MGQVGIPSRVIQNLDGLFYTAQGKDLKVFSNLDDMLSPPSVVSGVNGIWANYCVGAGAGIRSYPTPNTRVGIAELVTGTTTTGYASLLSSLVFANGDICFGAGDYTFETEVAIPTLGTVPEAYIIRIGFLDQYGDGVDGAYFKYDALSDTSWLCVTTSNSSRSTTSSGVIVNAATWYKLKIIVNALGTAVYFLINDTLVQTHTANIPTGSGRETLLHMSIIKSAGTTDRNFLVDWTWYHQNLLVSR